MEKGKLMMIIIIVLLVVLLGTVVGVSFYVMNMVKAQQEANENTVIQGGTQPYKILPIEDIEGVSLGDPITTNLAPSPDGTNHIAKIGITIGYDKSNAKDADAFALVFNEKLPFARGIAIDCIYASTYEDLNSSEGKASLADRIKTQLIDAFQSNLIVSVTFDEWIVQ